MSLIGGHCQNVVEGTFLLEDASLLVLENRLRKGISGLIALPGTGRCVIDKTEMRCSTSSEG